MLAVFGAKAYLIARFGTDLPFWDEWAKQGQMIITPYFTGTLHWADFFVPHSEHRIAPTLAVNLALVAAGGQWDGRVACLFNAALHALIILGVVVWTARAISVRWAVALAWISVGLYILPLDWENTLTSFQSQFYFLTGFSLAAMAGLLSPGGPRGLAWWGGLAAALLAGVSMGSGFLCVAPVLLVAGGRLITGPRRQRGDFATAVVALAILGAGWIWRPLAPWDAPMQAQSAAQFFSYALRCLAWPHTAWPWFAAVVWLPWLSRMVPPQRPRLAAASPAEEMLFAVGLWVGLQCAAIAYGRGGGPGDPAWRYADVFAIGVLCNALCFSGRRPFRRGAFALWLAAIFGAALLASWPLWHGVLPSVAGRSHLYETNVRNYIATGDAHALDGEVPFPDRAWLKQILDAPAMRAVLPPSVHVPPKVSWLSQWAREVQRLGAPLLVVGLALLWAGTRSLLSRTAIPAEESGPAAAVPPPAPARRPSARARRGRRGRLVALALALGCVVLGARWRVIEKYATDVPMMDEWDAQGLDELAPWFGGTFGIRNLTNPQNEHRSVLTKVLNLTLTLANRQWDQRVEMVLNAVWPAAIAALLFYYGSRRLPPRWDPALFGLLAALYALPSAWENITRGFASAQFFLVGLSAAAILLLPFASVRQGRWWLGAGALVLALGSMASGCLAGAIVAGLLALRAVRREISWPVAAPGLALAAITLAVGLATRAVVGANAPLQAQSLADFGLTLVRALGWPAFDQGWGLVALLLWLPWAALAVRVLAGGRRPVTAFEYGVLGLGAWCGLQILATVYARGAGGPPPASRYVDNLVVGLFANGLAAAIFVAAAPAGRRWRLGISSALWAALLLGGLALNLQIVWTQKLPEAAQYDAYSAQNTRNFLATGDRAYLQHNELPYPGANNFYDRITVPALRARMPAGARPPLALTAGAEGSGFWRIDTRAPERQGPALPALQGLAPDLPPLANAVVWGSFGGGPGAGAAVWTSQPLRRTIPGWLRFAIAGDLGRPGTDLELRDARTGELRAAVHPRQPPGERWHAAEVPAPAGEFVIAARSAPGTWFAFAQPVEMGRLSYLAAWAAKQGLILVAFGLGLALATIAWRWARSGT